MSTSEAHKVLILYFISLRVCSGPVLLGDGFRKVVQDFDLFVVFSDNYVEGASSASDMGESRVERLIPQVGHSKNLPSNAQSNGACTQPI